MQRLLLPHDVPRLAGWRIEVHYGVGNLPGGDYYDFLALPDGSVGFFLADATGHGAESAVLVAMTRVLLHACPLSSGVCRRPFCPVTGPIQPPDVLLAYLNRVLTENILDEQFLTAQAGLLCPEDGRFRYGNAGHQLPLWWRAAAGKVVPMPDTPGLPLGIDPLAEYGQAVVSLDPGDVLFAYTDGVTEARDAQGELFGRRRLEECFRSTAALGAAEVKARVLAGLASFLAGESPQDDVTFVVIERLARPVERLQPDHPQGPNTKGGGT